MATKNSVHTVAQMDQVLGMATGLDTSATDAQKANLKSALGVTELEQKVGSDRADLYKDTFYVCDANGNVIMQVDSDGVKSVNIQQNDWRGKVMATYGDSVTAINNGNYTYPYDFSHTSAGNGIAYKDWQWGNRVANYFRFAKHYGRGIGSQGYKWVTTQPNGGSVAFINEDGTLNSRDDNYNYENYTGETPTGTTKVRGCMASWLRITTMFPSSIKDNIDVIMVMAHNDSYDETACAFVSGDATDTEWAVSGDDYYGKIGGDYNISSFRGGVASTIMKLQLWMPNALIVLMTGISGRGTTGEINTDIYEDGTVKKANAIKEMSLYTSAPCIDVHSNDVINGWNRTTYIADSIHPYTVEGGKMVARAIVGGMRTIEPKNLFD